MKNKLLTTIYILLVVFTIMFFHDEIASLFVKISISMFSDYINPMISPLGVGGIFFVTMKTNSMLLLLLITPIIAIEMINENKMKLPNIILFFIVFLFVAILLFLEVSFYYFYITNYQLNELGTFDIEKIPFMTFGLIPSVVVIVSASIFNKKYRIQRI